MGYIAANWPVFVGLGLAFLVAWFEPRTFIDLYIKRRMREVDFVRESRRSHLMFQKIELEQMGELALISSILLTHFFVLLSVEADHFQEELSGITKVYFVNTPLVMSFVLVATYTISIPALVAKILINSNRDVIQVLVAVGATRRFIAKELRRSFISLIWRVAIKSIIIEFLMYSILVMTVSSFFDFILVNFPKVIIFSLVSIALFTGMTSLIIYRSGFRFAQKIMVPQDPAGQPERGGSDSVI